MNIMKMERKLDAVHKSPPGRVLRRLSGSGRIILKWIVHEEVEQLV
jgi:hypothetical protein